MPQLFHPSTNTISKFSIFGGAFLIGGLASVIGVMSRSPWATEVGVILEQPVPFSHAHHVRGLGIDCRYCHDTVETEAFAGMPATEVCYGCHSQIWSSSPILEPVRESQRENRPIAWRRVYDLPDFVYFHHGIHVQSGIGCSSCHGRVDLMPILWQAEPLQMEWCLGCHRDPVAAVRPQKDIFLLDYDPTSLPLAERKRLAKEYGISKATDCDICHR